MSDETTIGLLATLCVLLLSFIVVWVGRAANRLDAERRAAEAARQATEFRFEVFAKNAPFVTYLKDTDGRYLFSNLEAERVYGWPDAELRGKTARDFHDPATAAEIEAADRRVLTSGEILLGERQRSGSRGYEWATVVKFPVLDDSGRIIAIGGFDIDITERKRAVAALEESEARLRASEYRYRHVVDLIQEAVWIHLGGEIVFANPAAVALFGADSPDQLIGRSIFSFMHPDDRVRAEERTRLILEKRPVPFAETRLLGLDGQWRLGELRGIPFDQDGRPYIMAVGRDVTRQRETEAQLRHAQRLQAVGQLTGGIAHDFNNLLTVVIGSLDMALGPVNGNLRTHLESAHRAAKRGAALVQRLLAFSRKQALTPEPLDFNRVVAEMDGLIRRTLGEHIEIEVKEQANLSPALADRAQIESALLNLAINARDAMPAGGKLIIETGNAHLDDDYAAINAEVAPGDYTLLAVTDTGTGMTPEVLEHIFEPFFTTKRAGKGTGLGLSSVYGFVKQSGGHVKVYSEVGHGTTIRLYLPRASTEAAPSADAAAPVLEQLRGSETILVVEDDDDVRAFVVTQLRNLGYTVLEAADGPKALVLLESDVRIDLLFTDVLMPGGLTGRQLVDDARLRRPRLKALYTSGYTEDAILHHGTIDSGVHFLPKPYVRKDLALKVRAVLGG